MLKKKISARLGFTLLELLIVSAIIIIVTGSAIAALATFQDRQEALIVAKAVQQMMWSAQTKARVREVPNIPTQCVDGQLVGYRVRINEDNAQLQPICFLESGTPQYTGSPTIQQINFDSNDSDVRAVINGADATASYQNFVFRALEGGVTSDWDATPAQIGDTVFAFVSNDIPSAPTYSFTLNTYGAISNVSLPGGAQDL